MALLCKWENPGGVNVQMGKSDCLSYSCYSHIISRHLDDIFYVLDFLLYTIQPEHDHGLSNIIIAIKKYYNLPTSLTQ